MPTVLDSFVIELGLDPEKLNRGQRDAMNKLRRFEQEATRSGKSIESQSKKTSDLFAQTKKEVLGGLGLIMGFFGAKKFIDQITNLDAMTGRFAKTIGMNVGDLATWEGAIKQMGGSAQEAISGLGGLAGELNRFLITGQGGGLTIFKSFGIDMYDQNKRLKTAGQLWLELSAAVQGMDPARAAAFLSLVPGATQSLINFALLGPKAMNKYLDASKRTNDEMKDAAQAAQDYQKSVSLLDQAWMNLGRHLETWVMPALRGVIDLMAGAIKGLDQSFNTTPGTPGRDSVDRENDAETEKQMKRLGLGPPGDIFGKWPDDSRSVTGGNGGATTPSAPGTAPGYTASVAEIEAYIRKAAVARGINPDVAVQVYRNEGKSKYTGDHGTSFGPMQLHVGGGLGDKFKGNLRDPSTWKAQVDFGLDEAVKDGWRPWHGWHGASRAGLPSGGAALAPSVANNNRSSPAAGNSKTINVTMGDTTIVAPAANNPQDVADHVVAHVKRGVMASGADYGQN